MELSIRPVQPEDLSQVAEIYNHAVHNTAATFDIEPKSASDFTTYLSPPNPTSNTDTDTDTSPNTQTASLHRMIVATIPNPTATTDHIVVAYAGTSPFKPRAAYNHTAEVMIYVHPDYHGQGVGTRLLRRMHDPASGFLDGIHTTLGVMNSANATTRKMFEALGYVLRGELVDVGWKFGRRWSVVLYQLQLREDGEVDESEASSRGMS